MERILTDYESLLPIFLFLVLFCGASILLQKPQNLSRSSGTLNQEFYHLACLWEDAPESALRGQAYQLATPLMSPLACIWEDAPESVLCGQAYQLASPIACIVTRTWHRFYRDNLGKPGINYWQWHNFPESRNICRELSCLMDLPKPRGFAKEVLETLGFGENPFFELTTTKFSYRNVALLANCSDTIDRGKFASLDWQVQTRMRLAFRDWHETVCQLIGENLLKKIYEVCYGTTWAIIQKIIQQQDFEVVIARSVPWCKVLGVKSDANSLEVEAAYKHLLKIWHPDINKTPIATEITALINVAYQQYRSRQMSVVDRASAVLRDRRQIKKVDSQLFVKTMLAWLKPLLSR
jgi:hypothetical protein